MANENEKGGDPHKPKEVVIFVDDQKHTVADRPWIVKDLKATVGVDSAKVLAQITPHGLQDLDDNAQIQLKNGERFMSHARSGASS